MSPIVYTVEVPGHELAGQSVGVHGDDGFGAVYVSPGGDNVPTTGDGAPDAHIGPGG